jgi:phosphate uptake regulator
MRPDWRGARGSLGLLWRMSMGTEPLVRCATVQNIARYLERIGDHATNLALQVILVIRGRDVGR